MLLSAYGDTSDYPRPQTTAGVPQSVAFFEYIVGLISQRINKTNFPFRRDQSYGVMETMSIAVFTLQFETISSKGQTLSRERTIRSLCSENAPKKRTISHPGHMVSLSS